MWFDVGNAYISVGTRPNLDGAVGAGGDDAVVEEKEFAEALSRDAFA